MQNLVIQVQVMDSNRLAFSTLYFFVFKLIKVNKINYDFCLHVVVITTLINIVLNNDPIKSDFSSPLYFAECNNFNLYHKYNHK